MSELQDRPSDLLWAEQLNRGNNGQTVFSTGSWGPFTLTNPFTPVIGVQWNTMLHAKLLIILLIEMSHKILASFP